jgi:hypothetical protein
MKKFLIALNAYRLYKKQFKNSCLIYRSDLNKYEICLYSEVTVSKIPIFNFITNKPI